MDKIASDCNLSCPLIHGQEVVHTLALKIHKISFVECREDVFLVVFSPLIQYISLMMMCREGKCAITFCCDFQHGIPLVDIPDCKFKYTLVRTF